VWLVGDGPLRLASALELGDALAVAPQDAELSLLLFVHGGRKDQKPDGSSMYAYQRWLVVHPSLSVRLFALCVCCDMDRGFAVEITHSREGVPYKIAPNRDLSREEAEQFFGAFFRELSTHARQPRLAQPRLEWQTVNACYQKTKHLAHGKMTIGSGMEQDIASHMQMAKIGLPIALLFLLISLFMAPLAPLSYFVWTILMGLFFGGCVVLQWWSAGGASSMLWFMLGIGTVTMGRFFLEIEILSLSFKEYSAWLAIQYGAILFSVACSGWLLLRKRIERFLGGKNSLPDS
jgi:sulfur relay (sulfurtransferase) complex TusBCD TusD component (DsrE family)